MYDPFFVTCFGHTDEIGFAFIDDMSAIVEVAARVPQLDSYTIANEIDLSVFRGNRGERLLSTPAELLSTDHDLPLFAVTHIKLNGAVSLAYGGSAQAVTASLILKRAFQAVNGIKSYSHSEPLFATSNCPRLAVLDPISAEDILIITRCDNYSYAASILTAIRQLTFGDFWSHASNVSTDLREAVLSPGKVASSNFSPGEFIGRIGMLGRGEQHSSSLYASVGSNHLIASTYTTLGVVQMLGSLEPIRNAYGSVSFQVLADVNPGHECDVARQIPIGIREFECSEVPTKDFEFVIPGKHDLTFGPAEKNSVTQKHCVRTSEFLAQMSVLLSSYNASPSGSGLQDFNTNIAIPIPSLNGAYCAAGRLLKPQWSRQRHSDYTMLLKRIGAMKNDSLGLNDVTELSWKMREVGLGPSARSAVINLLVEYVTAISDPLFLDSVVDLDDAFFILHSVICGAYEHLAKDAPHHYERIKYRSKIKPEIIDLYESLKHAFRLRVGRSSAKQETRFGDLRGSVTTLLSAGDSVLKSSLGVFRRMKFPDDYDQSRRLVTGVISPHVTERATVKNARLMGKVVSLLRVDAMHIFRPDHLTRVLHEIGHAYFDDQICTSKEDVKAFASEHTPATSLDNLFVVCQECFADGLVHALIFGNDSETFVKHQIYTFNSLLLESPFANAPSPIVAAGCWGTEFLLRLYLIVSAIGQGVLTKESECPTVQFDVDGFSRFAKRWCRELRILDGISRTEITDLCAMHSDRAALTRPIFQRFVWGELRSIYHTLGRHRLCTDTHINSPFCKLLEETVFENPAAVGNMCNQEDDESVAVFHLVYVYIRRMLDGGRGTSDCQLNGVLSARNVGNCSDFTAVNSVVKGLWQISTRQRMRRFATLLDEVEQFELQSCR